MKTPTDNELLIVGLKEHLMQLRKQVDKDIESYQDDFMTLESLVFCLTNYNIEIVKTLTRIQVASPEIDNKSFAADDIPF